MYEVYRKKSASGKDKIGENFKDKSQRSKPGYAIESNQVKTEVNDLHFKSWWFGHRGVVVGFGNFTA